MADSDISRLKINRAAAPVAGAPRRRRRTWLVVVFGHTGNRRGTGFPQHDRAHSRRARERIDGLSVAIVRFAQRDGLRRRAAQGRGRVEGHRAARMAGRARRLARQGGRSDRAARKPRRARGARAGRGANVKRRAGQARAGRRPSCATPQRELQAHAASCWRKNFIVAGGASTRRRRALEKGASRRSRLSARRSRVAQANARDAQVARRADADPRAVRRRRC